MVAHQDISDDSEMFTSEVIDLVNVHRDVIFKAVGILGLVSISMSAALKQMAMSAEDRANIIELQSDVDNAAETLGSMMMALTDMSSEEAKRSTLEATIALGAFQHSGTVQA